MSICNIIIKLSQSYVKFKTIISYDNINMLHVDINYFVCRGRSCHHMYCKFIYTLSQMSVEYLTKTHVKPSTSNDKSLKLTCNFDFKKTRLWTFTSITWLPFACTCMYGLLKSNSFERIRTGHMSQSRWRRLKNGFCLNPIDLTPTEYSG